MSLVKQIVIVLAVGASVFGGYIGWQHYGIDAGSNEQKAKGFKGRALAVEVAIASMRKIDTIVEAVGTTRAVRSVNVTPLSSGRIVEIGFTAGSQIKENAVLLRLDSEVQRVNLAEAEAKLKEANSALKRSTILQRSRAVSESTVDRLVAAAEIAKAERDRTAKQLHDRVVRAPFAGRIGFSSVERGALVKEGEVIAILDDLSAVEVEFSVPEGLFGRLKIGDNLQARAAPFPDRAFTGNIAAIDTRIDSLSRAFKVRGLITNDDKALPAGMFVHVSIVMDGTDALSIPEEAVVADGNRAFVFVVAEGSGSGQGKKKRQEKGNTVSEDSDKRQNAAPDNPAGKKGTPKRIERRQVTLGRRSYGYVEIKEGLQVDEAVVIRGIQKVRDGALVRIGNGKPSKKAGGKHDGQKSGKKPNTATQPTG